MVARRIAVFVAGGMAIGLLLASSAFACFVAGTSPYVSVAPHRAEAGTRVTVTGGNWVAGTDPVAIRWGGADGPVVASGFPSPDTRGGFKVAFTVPDEQAGPVRVYAVQAGSTTADAVFEVTTPTTTPAPIVVPPTQETKTAVATTGAASANPETPTAGPSASPETAAAGQLFAGAPMDTQAGPAAQPATVTAPSVNTAPVRRGPGQAVAASPLATSASGPSTVPEADAVPSLRSGSADVWSGLASEPDRTGVPSLAGLADGSPSGTGAGAVAVVVVVGGLIALAGGFAAAELGRRKAMVVSRGD